MSFFWPKWEGLDSTYKESKPIIGKVTLLEFWNSLDSTYKESKPWIDKF